MQNDTQKSHFVSTARGLDIAEIRTVVNYDVARDIDTHVHRVGRTGRAGVRGFAFTLLTDKDENFAVDLVHSLEEAGQPVTNAVMDLAMKSPKYFLPDVVISLQALRADSQKSAAHSRSRHGAMLAALVSDIRVRHRKAL